MSQHPKAAPGPSLPALLFVHAHPDDETLTTGITLAHYRRLGHDVQVLTCTLGEQGEVIPPELAHRDADHDDTLGPWRREELRRAMAVLGVGHRVLGEDPKAGVLSRYRDSGMAGTPSANDPRAFAQAEVDEAAALVADVIRGVGAAVVVTYDEHGGYGHPDHIQTHRVTCAAVASLPEGERPELYAVVTPRSWAEEDRAWLATALAGGSRWAVPGPGEPYPPSVVEDDVVSHEILDPALVPLQEDALREHRTQVTVGNSGYYALSNNIAARISGREAFAPLDPATGALVPPRGLAARHTSLVGEGPA